MDWVKRNLYFVIGSAIAVVLMGLAGFYLYSSWSHKNEVFEKLSAQYAELKRLYELNPNPGSGKVDNIRAAREQQAELRKFVQGVEKFFLAPPPIPTPVGTNKVSSEEFTSQLRRTLDQLQRDAANYSVNLPPNYSFSFEAQKSLMRFAPGSLDALAVQLGEVKAICDVLLAAKINALDNLRRERVSNDDYKGPPSDYLEQKSVTNELAILVPYEVTFRCFSAELAGVLNGLHSSPHCLLAKTIDIEPAASAPYGADPNAPGGMSPDQMMMSRYGVNPEGMPPANPYAQRYGLNPEGMPAANPYAQRYGLSPEGGAAANPYARRYAVGGPAPGGGEGGMGQSFANRYGGGEGGGGASYGGIAYRPLTGAGAGTPYGQPAQPAYAAAQPMMPGQPTGMPGAVPGRTSLQTVLDEKPVRVTLLLHVVKLLPKEPRR
jgi:hypothetical protein